MAETTQQSTAPPENPEVAELRRRAEESERELALRRALAGVDWFDPDDAYRELAGRAERDGAGQWRITLPAVSGETEAQRVSPAEAARQLAGRKPHWVRARVLGGSGAGGGAGAGAGASITYAELLRPENAAKLREYLHDRPEELERLRQAHFKK